MKFSVKTILIALLSVVCLTLSAQKPVELKIKIVNNTFKMADLAIAYGSNDPVVNDAKITPNNELNIKTTISKPDIYKLTFDEGSASFLLFLNPSEKIVLEINAESLQNIISVSGSNDMTFIKNMSDIYATLKTKGDSINDAYVNDAAKKYYNDLYTQFQMFYQTNQSVDTFLMNAFADYNTLYANVQSVSKKGKFAAKNVEGFVNDNVNLLKQVEKNYRPFENYQKNVTAYYDFGTPNPLADKSFQTVLVSYVNSNNAKNNIAATHLGPFMPAIKMLVKERDSLVFNDLLNKKNLKVLAKKIHDEVLKMKDLTGEALQFLDKVPLVQKSGVGIPDLSKQMIQQRVQYFQQAFAVITQPIASDMEARIRAHKESLACLMFLDLYPREQYGELHADIINALKAKYPTHPLVKERVNALVAVPIAVGSMAPDLAFPNPEGKIMKLSDLRGKIVLLDFWASWCGPCRKENPNVVKLYHKYKNDGFDVYSYSLDRTKQNWVDAIAKDGLVWKNHTSDLKGWQAEGAKPYKVRSIPSTYLIGKDGKIIAINPRGRELEKILKDIFGK